MPDQLPKPISAAKRLAIWFFILACICLLTGSIFLYKRIYFDIELLVCGSILLACAVVQIMFQKARVFQNEVWGKLVKVFEKVSIIIITLVCMLALTELLTRLVFTDDADGKSYMSKEKLPDGTYHEMHREPYVNAPYANNAFFEERFTQMREEFNGEYFTVHGGMRATVFQPETYQHTIWLFGASTLFCQEVPDEYTVGSQLQKYFVDAFGDLYRVEVIALRGWTIADQLNALSLVTLEPGDLVVFFDGYNEILSEINADSSTLQIVLGRSLFYRKFIRPIVNRGMPDSKNKIAEKAYVNMMQGITAADQMAEAYPDVKFIHFLQPSLYTLNEFSDYEMLTLEKFSTYHDWDEIFFIGYQRLLEGNLQLAAQGIISIDLTDILDHQYRSFTEEIYVDDVHVNHLGNALIAEGMFNFISDIIKDVK